MSIGLDVFCAAWAQKLSPFAGPMKMRRLAPEDLRLLWAAVWAVAQEHVTSRQTDDFSSWKLVVGKVFTLAQVDKRELEAGRYTNLPRFIFCAARDFVDRFNLVPRRAYKTPEHIKGTELPLRETAAAIGRTCEEVTFALRVGFDVLGELALDISRRIKLPCGAFGALVVVQRQIDFAFANGDDLCSIARSSYQRCGEGSVASSALRPERAVPDGLPRASTPALGIGGTLLKPLSAATLRAHNQHTLGVAPDVIQRTTGGDGSGHVDDAAQQQQRPLAVDTAPELRKLRSSQSQLRAATPAGSSTPAATSSAAVGGSGDEALPPPRFFAAKNRKYVVEDELRLLQQQLESRISLRRGLSGGVSSSTGGSRCATPSNASAAAAARSVSALGFQGTSTGVENWRKAPPGSLLSVMEAACHRQASVQQEERSLQRQVDEDLAHAMETARIARTKILVRKNLEVLALDHQLQQQADEKRTAVTPVSISKVIDTRPFEQAQSPAMSASLSPAEFRHKFRTEAQAYKKQLDVCSSILAEKRQQETKSVSEQEMMILAADKMAASEEKNAAWLRRNESRLQYTEAWKAQQLLRLPSRCGHD